ncbi:MAG TPA: serine hydrolase [Candidatus Dormibacteraeota bacterium]
MLKLAGAAMTAIVGLLLATLFIVVVVPDTIPLVMTGSRITPSPSPLPAVTPSPTALPSPSPSPSPTPLPDRTAAFKQLAADLNKLAAAGGARASVSLIELAGTAPTTLWSLNGNTSWQANSTYKLPLLMANAQGIATGKYKGTDSLCYKTSDYEAGWYDDYAPGKCFTRNVLATRVGRYSDNTAAHILVRYLGGSTALNAFATSMGATTSKFFLPNTTTSADLARLWGSEATGAAGGAAAQTWLYPLVTKTYWESGIPAGTPKGPVMHKVGYNGKSINDAALVKSGPHGAYVLAICTYGPGNAAGWMVVSNLAKRVWQFEAARPV